MIKKGDAVRFLNAVGGGMVVRIDDVKNIIYVEDEDGFEVPVLERECVLVGSVNANTNFPVKDFTAKPAQQSSQVLSPNQAEQKSEPIIETAEGEKLTVFLAFFPLDIKQLQTTSYECYLVNDSNYYLNFNVINGENQEWRSVANGKIEPNTQELLAEIFKDQLSAWERIRVQLLPFKMDKAYTPQNMVDVQLKINVVKFYKLHSFTANEYFDEPAMLVDIPLEAEITQEIQKMTDISPEEIRKAMFQKEDSGRPRIVKQVTAPEIIEIDLHINELLDSTAGMSNGEMLQCQIDKFHSIIAENKNRKGQKIVFIHGKGEGVLRSEIEKQLKSRYKTYNFQDASFREYGFGATMVTIR